VDDHELLLQLEPMNPLSAVLFWMAENYSVVRPLLLFFFIAVALAAIWYFVSMWEGSK
jgi:hypothetical protein